MASVPASRSVPPPPPVWSSQASAQASAAFGPPAGFWLRFVAVLIDSLVVTLPIMAVVAVVAGVIGYSGTGEDEAVAIAVIVFAVILPIAVIASWLYEALMTSSRRGATLGKRALGLRVIKDDGTQLGFGRATGRHFSKALITPMIPLGIGYLMAAFTERKRALHDMIANTLVIKDALGRTDFQRETAMTNVPSPGRVAPTPPA